MPPPPPLLDQASRPISPELVLVDRALAVHGRVERAYEPAATQLTAVFLDYDTREAMIRMCELSDVNPPRARRSLLLAVGVPAVLWTEALVLVASLVPFGAM